MNRKARSHARGSDPRRSDPPPRRRVFTNRNLRMDSIAAVGFDMDHTLAVYNTDNFNHLSFVMAIEALIRDKGYPEEIRAIDWEPEAAIRGLVVDKKLGNLLKIDAYNHVTRARHGRKFLDRDERRKRYPRSGIRLGTTRYRVFDTLFDLPEGSLYASLVHLKETKRGLLGMNFHTLYDDIRGAVDTLHADGSLKARITADLDSYFLKDPNLLPTLRKYLPAHEFGSALHRRGHGSPDRWEKGVLGRDFRPGGLFFMQTRFFRGPREWRAGRAGGLSPDAQPQRPLL